MSTQTPVFFDHSRHKVWVSDLESQATSHTDHRALYDEALHRINDQKGRSS
jgi:hypothetical protein